MRRERELDDAMDRQVVLAELGLRKVEEALGELAGSDVHPGQLAGMARTFADMKLQGLGYREGGDGKEAGGPAVQVVFVEGERSGEGVRELEEGVVVEGEFRDAGG